MIENAAGIILRTLPLTETSLIVHWLTPQCGRIATVAKGARRPKSSFAGKLDLFYEADFSFSRSRRSELHALREVHLHDSHPALRQDLARLEQAAYAAALLEQTTEIETPLLEIHALFAGFLGFLAQHPPKPRNVFAFELKLLRLLGLEPDLPGSKLAAETRVLVAALLERDWSDLEELQATAAQVRALRLFLHGFLIYHLGRIPAGRKG
jgi:DNA repair protein RecO (recombination protein O)